MKHKKRIKILAVAVLVVAAGVLFSCTIGQQSSQQQNETVLVQEESTKDAETDETQAAEDQICVHVCGAVKTPGVYYLSAGGRVFEAVEMAGGTTEDADSRYINLASQAEDGTQIYIPTKEEAAAGLPAGIAAQQWQSSDGKIDLNRATLEELKTLPGIGDVKAEAIIAYRESAGGFQSIDEIMNVAGIKQSAFDQIKNQIKV